jgi:hypothetical protein
MTLSVGMFSGSDINCNQNPRFLSIKIASSEAMLQSAGLRL